MNQQTDHPAAAPWRAAVIFLSWRMTDAKNAFGLGRHVGRDDLHARLR
jgi:hypothetical protein